MARLVSNLNIRFHCWRHATLAFLLGAAMNLAHGAAVNYSWPADLTGSPFNCSETSPSVYTCPAISFSKNTSVAVTAPIKVIVDGDFYAFMADIGTSGNNLLLDVRGNVTFSKNSSGYLDIKATGSINIGMNSSIHGDLASSGGNVNVDKNSTIYGNVDANDDLYVGKHGRITGTCSYAHTNYICAGGTTPGFDHIMISHAPTGITCTPSTITIKACSGADSNGTCTAFNGGVSGTIVAAGGAGQELEFDIPEDSSQTTIALASSTATTYTLSTPDAKYSCWNGTSNSCQIEFEQAGFVFADIPNHWAGEQQASTLSAVSTTGSGKTCAPAYTSATPVTFRCAYVNPGVGSPLTLAFGSNPPETFSCGTDKSISVPFDGNGQAAFKLTYPDAGNITLTAFVGSDMNGQDSFIAAPASFRLTALENPIRAGKDAGITVEALTRTGAVAPSFGRETPAESVQLTFKRCQPSTDGPSDGVFTSVSAPFSNGAASYRIIWDEVGNGDLTAKLVNSSYLGSGLAPAGILGPSSSACSAADGALVSVPHHFQTRTGQAVYTYSGQAMKILVTAHAADHKPTSNYYIPSGTASRTVRTLTVEAWNGLTQNPGPGSWNQASVAPADISNDSTRGTVTFLRTYTLANKLTAPADATIRVKDAYTSSAGFEEAVTNIRNGRLRLSNAFGSINQDLAIPVMAQYWSGSTWILNSDDNYTRVDLPAIALTRSGAAINSNAAAMGTLVNGQGKIVITKPGSGTAGTVDVAINLGDVGLDISCLASHPASTGSALPWLRHTYGSCASPADPSARATFGVYPGQTKRTIYVREAFN
jgi:MSHA biogenesis protein MshQ